MCGVARRVQVFVLRFVATWSLLILDVGLRNGDVGGVCGGGVANIVVRCRPAGATTANERGGFGDDSGFRALRCGAATLA